MIGYAGLERELSGHRVLEDGTFEYISFDHDANAKHSSHDLLKSSKKNMFDGSLSFMTSTGGKIYADGGPMEAATAPHEISRGFATRVVESLGNEINHIVSCDENIHFTGYSTHLNLPVLEDSSRQNMLTFENGISAMSSIFLRTPLSGETYVRTGAEGTEEVVGDGIITSDQLIAATLLLTSYRIQINYVDSPIKVEAGPHAAGVSLSFHHSRNASISITDSSGSSENISKQTFVERTRAWLAPVLGELATESELSLLDDFITGRKKLEVDKTGFYAAIKKSGSINKGIYAPTHDHLGNTTLATKTDPSPISDDSSFYGSFVTAHGDSIELETLDWNLLEYSGRNLNNKNPSDLRKPFVNISGIDNIRNHAKGLFGKK